MRNVERKQHLLENIARLRRLQRRMPGDRDLSAIRRDHERELGETVSRRSAARFLGVSHTALDRWVQSGDLSLVQTPDGRWQVPVTALLDLRELVDDERLDGRRGLHHLESVMTKARRRAEQIQLDQLPLGERGDEDHGRPERRSLAYHGVLAGRLNGRMVTEALHRIWKWRDENKLDPRYADQWEEVLGKPIPEIRKLIVEDSQRGRDLRQTSPFAGALSEPERRRLLEAIH